MLERPIDVHDGHAGVVRYELSKASLVVIACVAGGLLGGALMWAGQHLRPKVSIQAAAQVVSPAAKQMTADLLSTSAELAIIKKRLVEERACAEVREAQRIVDMNLLASKVTAFPEFKSEQYRAPFETLKRTLADISPPYKLVTVPDAASMCPTGVPRNV